MELPITVMVVLFVSLVVGSVIIVFSNNILERASTGMPDLDKEDVKEKIIDVDSVSVEMVESLARQCQEDYHSRLDEVLCVIVRSNTEIDIPAANLEDFAIVDNYEENKGTLFIYYYGHSNEIHLES